MTENALTQVAPDGRGLEALSQSDMVLPHYILCQALTKVVRNDTTGKVKEGMFYNTLTKIATEAIEFQPLLLNKYFNLLKANGNKMEFEARVNSENDPRLVGRQHFAKGDKKADVNAVISAICVVDDMPAIIKFSKMAYRVGQELYTTALISRKALWATKYRLTAAAMVRKDNKFFVPVLTVVGPASEAELTVADKMYTTFKTKADDLDGENEATATEETPF